MIQIQAIIEDQVILARRHATAWLIEVQDMSSGVSQEFTCNDLQAGAIFGLMIGSDELDGKGLYALAEPVMIGLQQELRMIP